MSKLILNSECNLYAFQSKAVYSSRQVADEFKKENKNVLRSIDEITALKSEPSDELAGLKNGVSQELIKMLGGQTIEEFCAENFFESKYKDTSGKWNREVLMTYKGAMLVVMGFTGVKATIIKIGLLNRFEAMKEFILSLSTARLEHPAFTDAIMNANENPMHYHFSNEADMINRIVLGMSAKQFREAKGIAKGESIRPYLSIEQIKAIEALQRADIGLLMAMSDFEQRKQTLTQYFVRTRLKRIA